MGKIIYVNGGILVKSRYFKCKNGGAYFDTPPKGAEILEPNKTKDGYKYFEINDDNPQSIFNEYYAKGGFTAYDKWVSYLHRTLVEAYNSYLQRIEDIKELINIDLNRLKHNNILNRLFFINIIASLDTFICDTILTIITSDESIFERYANSIPHNQISMRSQDLKKQNCIGILEQKVFRYVLKQSYCNMDTIKNSYKKLCNTVIIDTNGLINQYFEKRHKLVHRNGRDDNDEYIIISNEELYALIEDTRAFVDQVMSKIEK